MNLRKCCGKRKTGLICHMIRSDFGILLTWSKYWGPVKGEEYLEYLNVLRKTALCQSQKPFIVPSLSNST